MARVDSWLAGPEQSLLITGGPGTGKSAFASHLVAISAGAEPASGHSLRANSIAASHFCRALDPSRIDPLRFVEDLSKALADAHEPYARALLELGDQRIEIHGTTAVGTVAPGAAVSAVRIETIRVGDMSAALAFERLVRGPLSGIVVSRPRLVVLVDALDEALTLRADETLVDVIADALNAGQVPPELRFLMTSRPDARIVDRFRRPATLRFDLLTDAPTDDVGRYACRRLSDVGTKDPDRIAGRVTAAAKGNFLYARYVLDEAIKRNDLELTSTTLPHGLDALYREYMERELARARESWEDRYRPLLGALAVARGAGLTGMQLVAAAGLMESQVDDAIVRLSQYVTASEPDGPFRIYHESFRDFLLTDAKYRVYASEANAAVAAFALEAYGEDWLHCTDAYALAHTPAHLGDAIRLHLSGAARAEMTAALTAMLSDFGFLERKTAALGIDALVQDLQAAAEVASGPLAPVLRLLDSERHRLRGWDEERMPAYFAQQLYSAAHDFDLQPLADAALQRLTALGRPHFSQVWRTGRAHTNLLRTLRGHRGPVTSVAVMPDGTRSVSGSMDWTMKAWDLASGNEIATFEGHRAPVRTVAITPDGRRAISGSDDWTLRLWDLESWEKLGVLVNRMYPVLAVAITPDGRWAVSGDFGHRLKVWDLRTGQPVRELVGHERLVWSVAITADGKRAVSASPDGTARLWELEDGSEVRPLLVSQSPVRAVTLAPDGRRAICGLMDGTVSVRDLEAGEELVVLGDRLKTGVASVVVTPDGARVVVGYDDGTLSTWDLASGERLGSYVGHGAAVDAVAVTPDGRTAVSASTDETLRVWNLQTAARPQQFRGHSAAVTVVAVTPDGRTGISASFDGTLKIWDLETGHDTRTLRGHEDRVLAVAVTPDGRSVISGSQDLSLRYWDLDSGEQLRLIAEPHSWAPVDSIAVSPDGRSVITASYDDRTLGVWDLSAGEPVRPLRGHVRPVLAVAVTPDGRGAVSGSADRTLKVWDLETGYETSTLQGHMDRVLAVAVSPCGRWALSGSDDQTLRVWDIRSGDEVLNLGDHQSSVQSVAITADGRRAISASWDGLVVVWDVETWSIEAAIALDWHPTSVALSPNSSAVMIGGAPCEVCCLAMVDASSRAGEVYE